MNITIPTTHLQHTPITVRPPVLKVLGLGGGGSNAVNRMIEMEISGVEYYAANTDAQALRASLAPNKIQLGPRLTRGLGAGGNPQIGEAAAEESIQAIKEALEGADLVFLTAGMGGGTGTGSIPIAARVARSLGALTVSTVTMPFAFEVGRRQKNAREGLAKLREYSDTLIGINNDRLLEIEQRDLPIDMAFRLADDMLRQSIQGISEIVTQPGQVNVDFAHIRQIVKSGGGSLLSMGYGQGDNKALMAVQQALRHPLLDEIQMDNVTGIIANFSGGEDLTFIEVAEALTFLQDQTGNQADVVFGVINDPLLENRAQVILIMTGLGSTPIDLPANKPLIENNLRQIETSIPRAIKTENRATLFTRPIAEPCYEGNIPLLDNSQVQEIVRVDSDSNPNPNPNLSSNNFDVPAFLRRRVRTAW